MCSPVEGPRRTETSHFLIKSLELKCHVHILRLFVLLYSNTRDAYLFVAMHYIYIYMCVWTTSCPNICLFQSALSVINLMCRYPYRISNYTNNTTLKLHVIVSKIAKMKFAQ